MRLPALGLSFCLALGVTAAGAEFAAQTAHKSLIEAFNSRDWAAVRKVLADDVVFHRANAKEVFIGADAVVAALKQPIAESWNVKFATLNSTNQFAGKDGRVVERGDFGITAGSNNETCYRGSYMMTWLPQTDQSWKLQILAWQDVETEMANCKT
jgi:ketosteroid isomerase-like protein